MLSTASQPPYDRNGNASPELSALRQQSNNAHSYYNPLDDVDPLQQQRDSFPDFLRSEELIEPDPLLEAVTPHSLSSTASDYYYTLSYTASSPRPIPRNKNDHLLQLTADGPAILCDSPTPKELPIYSPPDVPTGVAISTTMDSDTASNFTPRASHDYDYYDNTPPSTPPNSTHAPQYTSSQSYTTVPKVARQVSNPTSSRDQDAPSSRPRSVPPPPRPASQDTRAAPITSSQRESSTHPAPDRERERDRTEHRSSTDDQVRVKPRKVLGNYTLTKTLGAGSMGKVKLAVHSITGEKLAVKIIPRSLLQKPDASSSDAPAPKDNKEKDENRETRTIREASIMLLLHHPFIVSLKEVMVLPHHYYMFLEYVNGGQLLDYIISHGKLKEKQARKFARQIVSALDYCHRNSIVHRDLKIENILISKSGNIKIIDFGLSNLYSPQSHLSTFCGSLYFAAPELLNAKLYTGPEVDVWSFGIVLYVLVCGKVPFDDQSMPALHAKIKRGVVEYPSFLSSDCKNLLSRMLVTNPSHRATISEIIMHPWMNKGYDGLVENHLPHRPPLSAPIDMEVVRGMTGFEFGMEQEIKRELEAIISTDQYQKAAKTLAQSYSSHPVGHMKQSGMSAALSNAGIGSRKSFSLPNDDPQSVPSAYHPLISVYYLVKEKLERERLERLSQQVPYSSSESLVAIGQAGASREALPVVSIPSMPTMPETAHAPDTTFEPATTSGMNGTGGVIGISIGKKGRTKVRLDDEGAILGEGSNAANADESASFTKVFTRSVSDAPRRSNDGREGLLPGPTPKEISQSTASGGVFRRLSLAIGRNSSDGAREKSGHGRNQSIGNGNVPMPTPSQSERPGKSSYASSAPLRKNSNSFPNAKEPVPSSPSSSSPISSKRRESGGANSSSASSNKKEYSGKFSSMLARATSLSGDNDPRRNRSRHSTLQGKVAGGKHATARGPVQELPQVVAPPIDMLLEPTIPVSETDSFDTAPAPLMKARTIQQPAPTASGNVNMLGHQRSMSAAPVARYTASPLREVERTNSSSTPKGGKSNITSEATSFNSKTPQPGGTADQNIRPVFIKGLFSVTTTSTKHPSVIRSDLIRVLERIGVKWREGRGGFECVHVPSIDLENVTGISSYQTGAMDENSTPTTSQLHPPRSARRDGDNFSAKSGESGVSGKDKELPPLPSEVAGPSNANSNAQGAAVPVPDLVVRFEIYIVKVPWLLGMHGLQFRRVGGDPWQYKNMCSKILNELKL